MLRLSDYNIVMENDKSVLIEGLGWIDREITIDDREDKE